jgi:hypothetical protein
MGFSFLPAFTSGFLFPISITKYYYGNQLITKIYGIFNTI